MNSYRAYHFIIKFKEILTSTVVKEEKFKWKLWYVTTYIQFMLQILYTIICKIDSLKGIVGSSHYVLTITM